MALEHYPINKLEVAFDCVWQKNAWASKVGGGAKIQRETFPRYFDFFDILIF